MTGIRCDTNCNSITPTVPIDTEFRLWSEPSSWIGNINQPGRVPLEGDNVIIESGWNMLYDIAVADSVKLKML